MRNTLEVMPDFPKALSALSLLQAGRPSITAERVALRRAAHQVLDSPLVFEDLLALAIVGRDNASDFKNSKNAEAFDAPFIRAFMAARSRYAEDQLAQAANEGVSQYVILGAGLDTFAYRNPHEGLHVFELDHPATQTWKRERLASAQIPVPESVNFVPVDFEKQSLGDALASTPFEPHNPAFFSWLGVTPYLTLDAFDETIRFIASMPAKSAVAFDYAVARSALSPFEQCAFDVLANRVADVGEKFKLFFEPEQVTPRLEAAGFRYVEDCGSPEINARYFSDRQDGLQLLGNFAHLVTARL